MWLNMAWTDHNLKWNSSEVNNITEIRVKPDMIWAPDVVLINSASEEFDPTFKTNIIVYSDGTCVYIPPGIFQTTCTIDITWFPFDDQSCNITFTSWTHPRSKLNLSLSESEGIYKDYIESAVNNKRRRSSMNLQQ